MTKMQHDLKQGSTEWHLFRDTHDGASEASAMLGISPYKTRTELLNEKKTGIKSEVDAMTQRIFDSGHEIEKFARAIVERNIGEELFPVTCSMGRLSASCDGLTFDETLAWECKSANAEDLQTVIDGNLPEKHWPQVQQVLLVTGAKKLIFTISDGTEQNTHSIFVEPNKEQQQRIIDGWAQFHKDLESHVPTADVVKVVAEPVFALPSLSIHVGGQISIQSNLDRFGERLKAFIDETNAKPETDQDFANLEQACKVLKEAEDALKQAEASALAQTASVDEMRRTVSYLADVARSNRLSFEKLVKSEKENRKAHIVLIASSAYSDHINALQNRLTFKLNIVRPNFYEAIKGKKTLSSMQDAVSTMLANAKTEANALVERLISKKAWFEEAVISPHYQLFPDFDTIIYKDQPDFELLVTSRVKDYFEQERIKAEQAAKDQAEREERIRIEAEEKARRESSAREEQIRKEAAEQAAKAERERIQSEKKAEENIAQALLHDVAAETMSSGMAKNTIINDATKCPGRQSLITTIASKFFVTPEEAEQWLITEFGVKQKRAA